MSMFPDPTCSDDGEGNGSLRHVGAATRTDEDLDIIVLRIVGMCGC